MRTKQLLPWLTRSWAWQSISIARHKSRQLRPLFALLVCILSPLNVPAQTTQSVRLLDFAIVELRGRPGHEGLFPIQGDPIAGSSAFGRARLIGPYQTVSFLLLDADGNILSELSLATDDNYAPGTFYGSFVVPAVPFTIVAAGTDQSGQPFQVAPAVSPLAVPTTVTIEFLPARGEFSPATTGFIFANVTNNGPSNSFAVAFSDNAGGIVEPNNAVVTLAAGQSRAIELRVKVPASMKGEALELRGDVVSQAGEEVRNFATRLVWIDDSVARLMPVDVRPGSCKDGLSVHAKGQLPVAIYWTAILDPATVKVSSLRLVGLVPALKSELRDIGGGKKQSCNNMRKDGRRDLILHFDIRSVLEASASMFQHETKIKSIPVSIDGLTNDGQPVQGWGRLTFLSPKENSPGCSNLGQHVNPMGCGNHEGDSND
jgi:hypothetical protein